MRNVKLLGTLALFAIVILIAGCSGQTSMSNNNPGANTGTVVVLGTDNPPLPAVIDFTAMVTSVQACDASNVCNELLSGGPQTVDFSRLDGLRSLLDENAVPPDTYTTVQVSLSSPVITYIDTTQTPPVIAQLNSTSTPPATFTNNMVTVTLPQPLVLASTDLVGLLIDFRLRDSIQLTNGLVNGSVNPVLKINAVAEGSADFNFDCFRAGVVSVNTSMGTFVVQGPHGRQYTVVPDTNVDWEDGASISSLTTNSIVEISGALDRATGNIDAAEIDILSQDHFLLDGLVTYVNPSSGPATELQLFVWDELPAPPALPIGAIDTLALNGSESYRIRFIQLPVLSSLLFNQGSILAGQRITVGGALGANNAVTVHRVVLDWQGQEGSWVVGSTTITSGNQGTFTLADTSLAGGLVGGATGQVQVLTSNFTQFNGLSGLSALSGTSAIPLRVVGLILKDPVTGTPIIAAARVDEMQ